MLINAKGRNEPLLPDRDPSSVYSRVFADLPSNDGQTEPVFDRIRQGKLSVLDATKERLRALSQRLGSFDRARMEQHLTAIRDIERSLAAPLPQPVSCSAPPKPVAADHLATEAYPAVTKSMIDQTVYAFACDLTRVVTFQTFGQQRHPFASEPDEWHDLSHLGQSGNDSGYVRATTNIGKWYVDQFAYLFDQLKSTPEGNGTVFDNTAFVWVQDVREGSSHAQDNMPFLIAGSCGGYFDTGRVVNFSGESHNRLLVNLLHAMGINENEFGRREFSEGGPLPGLTG